MITAASEEQNTTVAFRSPARGSRLHKASRMSCAVNSRTGAGRLGAGRGSSGVVTTGAGRLGAGRGTSGVVTMIRAKMRAEASSSAPCLSKPQITAFRSGPPRGQSGARRRCESQGVPQYSPIRVGRLAVNKHQDPNALRTARSQPAISGASSPKDFSTVRFFSSNTDLIACTTLRCS